MNKIIFSLFLVITFPLYAKDSELELINQLPQEILNNAKGEISQYKDPRLGASVDYRYIGDQDFIKITVILFDAGYQHIDNGLGSKEVPELFKLAISDIKYYEEQGVYKNVRTVYNSKINLLGTYESLLLQLQFVYDFQIKGIYQQLDSYLLMTGAKGYILKIRASGTSSTLTKNYIIKFSEEIMKSWNQNSELTVFYKKELPRL